MKPLVYISPLSPTALIVAVRWLRVDVSDRVGWKLLAILLILMLPTPMFAQSDTITRVRMHDLASNQKFRRPLMFVDGHKSRRQMRQLQADNVYKVEVIKGPDAVARYGDKGENGVILITTKKYVVNSYQNLLISKSKEYASYLKTTSGSDQYVGYVFNGHFLDGTKTIMDTLYEVKAEEIKSVGFIENPHYNGDKSSKYIAVIVTKAK